MAKSLDPSPVIHPETSRSRRAGPVRQIRRLARRARQKVRRLGRIAIRRGRKLLASAEPAAPRVLPSGVVETLNGKEILGWIHAGSESGSNRVSLYLNDIEVASVEPIPRSDRLPSGQVHGFRFKLRDMWKYAGPDDRITVRLDGHALPMSGRGMYYRPRNARQLPVKDLKLKLGSGYVVASNGALIESKTTDIAWQEAVIGLYNRVRRALKEVTGYDAFFIYGSLLGAVRDNDFIGHDLDFDAAYVSRHQDPDLVGAEVGEIAMALMERGFRVESHVVCLYIYDDISEDERIDLFHLFFDDSGVMQFTWGIAGTTPFRLDQWQGTTEIEFARSTGLIPHQAEALVETIYGPHWRIPNPGFAWARDRVSKSSHGRVPPKVGSLVNWTNFWSEKTFAEPSSFLKEILGTADLPQAVVDLGCGDGRDSTEFAAAGFRVTGLDWCTTALSRADERANALPEGARPRYVQCDFDDLQSLTAVILENRERNGQGNVLYYGRFLLHAIFPDTEEALLQTLSSLSQPGDRLALEFRGRADSERPKWNRLPYRRFLDADLLVDQLTRLGFAVSHSDEGVGFAPLEAEDPYLHRILAAKSATQMTA